MHIRFLGCFLAMASCLFGSNQWEPTETVWNWGIITSTCNQGVPKNPLDYFQAHVEFDPTMQDFPERAVVWIKSSFIENFTKTVLPKLQHPIVLVISVGDESFPSNCFSTLTAQTLIENQNILHIFAQNCDIVHPKVTPLPIGLDFHTIAYTPNGAWGEVGSPSQQERCLKKILAKLQPTHLRKKRAFVDFQLNDTMRVGFHRSKEFGEDRSAIFKKLIKTGLIDHGNRMRRSKLWKKKGEYAFSISPPGNGLDCHRTWEDLTLGCIVIVKSSPLNPLFEGLPVVIVQDWSEITEKNMKRWLKQYGDAFTNPNYRKKLTNAYWIEKIHSEIKP